MLIFLFTKQINTLFLFLVYFFIYIFYVFLFNFINIFDEAMITVKEQVINDVVGCVDDFFVN